jgi:long-chain acyl-CoA synthetase
VESLDSFSKNLVDASPTHFGSVPRIWVKFQQGILAKMPQRKLDILLKIPIINSIIKKKIRAALGFKDTQLIVVGAAPMPDILMQWFRKLGFVIQNVYAMTENTAGATIMPYDGIKDGTVGKPLANTQIKIVPETGEICTKSPYTMLGYYKEPQMTAETIDTEGWLHTGDVGEIDSDGYLRVTGRVKEMYKTSKGEYVAPAQIEMGYAENNFIEQICVVGESLPQPIALVVLSELAKTQAKEVLAESLNATRKTLNPQLKTYERVHRIVVMPEPWTVENNMMTPTLKLKRKEIEKNYSKRYEQWYASAEDVVWG